MVKGEGWRRGLGKEALIGSKWCPNSQGVMAGAKCLNGKTYDIFDERFP